MDILKILSVYYSPLSEAFRILYLHGTLVSRKAREIAARIPELNPDLAFIHEAAMLHDIGICMTDSPSMGCKGPFPYIAHGYLGRQILEDHGLPRHALVCERHVGVGISAVDISRHNLPLPARDMIPLTIEERIICYADKFYSKVGAAGAAGKSVSAVRAEIALYGEEKLRRFDDWAVLLREPAL